MTSASELLKKLGEKASFACAVCRGEADDFDSALEDEHQTFCVPAWKATQALAVLRQDTHEPLVKALEDSHGFCCASLVDDRGPCTTENCQIEEALATVVRDAQKALEEV